MNELYLHTINNESILHHLLNRQLISPSTEADWKCTYLYENASFYTEYRNKIKIRLKFTCMKVKNYLITSKFLKFVAEYFNCF